MGSHNNPVLQRTRWPHQLCKNSFNEIFEANEVKNFLILLSKLAVFSKEFAKNLQHNLDLLAILKKLKYFNNLSIGENLIHFKNLCNVLKKTSSIDTEKID